MRRSHNWTRLGPKNGVEQTERLKNVRVIRHLYQLVIVCCGQTVASEPQGTRRQKMAQAAVMCAGSRYSHRAVQNAIVLHHFD